MRTSLKILLLAALVGAFAAGTFADRIAPTQPRQRNDVRVRTVKVARVEPANYVRDIRFSGVTRSVHRGKLSFTLGERLISRPVEVGDHVEKRQVLAALTASTGLTLLVVPSLYRVLFAREDRRMSKTEGDLVSA